MKRKADVKKMNFLPLKIPVELTTRLEGTFDSGNQNLTIKGYEEYPIPINTERGCKYESGELTFTASPNFPSSGTFYEIKVKYNPGNLETFHFYWHRYLDTHPVQAFSIIIGEDDMRYSRIMNALNAGYACSIQYNDGYFILKMKVPV